MNAMVGIRRISWTATGVAMLLWLIFWVVYDIRFKPVINDYQKRQIEQNIKENFLNNRQSFDEFGVWCKQLGVLRNLEFEGNGIISFNVYDSLGNRAVSYENMILADEDTDIVFLESNELLVFSENGRFTCKNWSVEFRGHNSHYLVERLLAYNGIHIDQLNSLEQKLEDINCLGIDKSEDLIAIRYAGHIGEGFVYIIPLTDTLNVNNWNKLSDDFYWTYFRQSFSCKLTDW
jgi:hypothetical protein